MPSSESGWRIVDFTTLIPRFEMSGNRTASTYMLLKRARRLQDHYKRQICGVFSNRVASLFLFWKKRILRAGIVCSRMYCVMKEALCTSVQMRNEDSGYQRRVWCQALFFKGSSSSVSLPCLRSRPI